jgi:hypothetical protein
MGQYVIASVGGSTPQAATDGIEKERKGKMTKSELIKWNREHAWVSEEEIRDERRRKNSRSYKNTARTRAEQ